MYYSPIKMKELLNKHGFNLKKMYGQNFIIDENIITNIINAANIDKETLVIEIGPGAGSLTYKLSEKAKNVICYEIDTTLKEVLNETLKEKENVEIIYQDFLKANILEQIKKYEYKKLYVVANLPYYITTPIIIKIIEDNIKVDKMVVMVQKEVGDRFKATPGSKDYSSLSVFLNYYFDVKKLLDISKNVFLPKPNVDSSVIILSKRESNIKVKDVKYLDEFLKNCFKFKRKNLRNNLKGYDLNKINNILNKYGYDLSSRAENISIDIFVEIVNELLG